MRGEDISVIREKFKEWSEKINPKKILILSPDKEELRIVKFCAPDAQIKIITQNDWDFRNECPLKDKDWDVLIFSNTMLYCTDLKLWFKNISKVCKYVWIQDAVDGPRGKVNGYFGDDGDSSRFKCSGLWDSNYPHAKDFDVAIGKDSIEDHSVYKLKTPGTHFVALFNVLKMKLGLIFSYFNFDLFAMEIINFT